MVDKNSGNYDTKVPEYASDPDFIRRQVRIYLKQMARTWGAALGVTNVGILAIAVGYIFFILPEKAITEATVRLDKQVMTTSQHINDRLTKLLVSFGEVRSKSRNVAEEAQQLQAETKMLIDETKALSTEIARIGTNTDSVQNELSELQERITDIDGILSSLEKLNSEEIDRAVAFFDEDTGSVEWIEIIGSIESRFEGTTNRLSSLLDTITAIEKRFDAKTNALFKTSKSNSNQIQRINESFVRKGINYAIKAPNENKCLNMFGGERDEKSVTARPCPSEAWQIVDRR